jgi:hypothetical protein
MEVIAAFLASLGVNGTQSVSIQMGAFKFPEDFKTLAAQD